jgi:hypothetical protein
MLRRAAAGKERHESLHATVARMYTGGVTK